MNKIINACESIVVLLANGHVKRQIMSCGTIRNMKSWEFQVQCCDPSS